MMKFVVDCMLGKLAKWLKILGFDTVYLNKAEDRDLLLIARRQQRTLLTKDHGLLEAAKDVRSLFIESDDWPEQLAQVLDTYKLGDAVRPHSRCLSCNVELKIIPKR
ncbi:MAG TPA: Mut7-C RNAse domain-containing protein, partial [Candidatus Desulfaltia sp.]|nr:Mut7-C RNAse domain-containing protein [Candidatus Desulfaltia sp.]